MSVVNVSTWIITLIQIIFLIVLKCILFYVIIHSLQINSLLKMNSPQFLENYFAEVNINKLNTVFSITPITDKTFTEPDNMSNTRSILLETGTAYLRENYCSTQIWLW